LHFVVRALAFQIEGVAYALIAEVLLAVVALHRLLQNKLALGAHKSSDFHLVSVKDSIYLVTHI
jgi:hypothetical protein